MLSRWSDITQERICGSRSEDSLCREGGCGKRRIRRCGRVTRGGLILEWCHHQTGVTLAIYRSYWHFVFRVCPVMCVCSRRLGYRILLDGHRANARHHPLSHTCQHYQNMHGRSIPPSERVVLSLARKYRRCRRCTIPAGQPLRNVGCCSLAPDATRAVRGGAGARCVR